VICINLRVDLTMWVPRRVGGFNRSKNFLPFANI